MAINFSTEKFLDIPLTEDAVSLGTLNASNITPYLKLNNTIVSGSYGYETITITLKGIDVPPFDKVTAENIGQQTFSFRDREWKVIKTQEGSTFNIAGQKRYFSWSVTGVDMNTPLINI